MTDWTNSDGLVLRFGVDKTLGAQVGGALAGDGVRKQVVAVLEASRMDLTGGLIGGRANHLIPENAYVEEALFVVTEAFDSGGSATLDLGIANSDGSYTTPTQDEDGIDSAIAEADIDTAGKEITCDGDVIGTILSNDAYLSYDVDTAAFTTGKGYLIVTYIPEFYPNQDAD